MLDQIAVVSVVTRPLSLSDCDLCKRGVAEVRAAVAIQHSSGSAVSFVACDHCVHAVRRIAAAAGGLTRFVLSGQR